jgi:hypothetical protein
MEAAALSPRWRTCCPKRLRHTACSPRALIAKPRRSYSSAGAPKRAVGILVAANGITGDLSNITHAHALGLTSTTRGIKLIVITTEEITNLSSEAEFVELLHRRLLRAYATGTVGAPGSLRASPVAADRVVVDFERDGALVGNWTACGPVHGERSDPGVGGGDEPLVQAAMCLLQLVEVCGRDESLCAYSGSLPAGPPIRKGVLTPWYMRWAMSPWAACGRLWQWSIQIPGLFAMNAMS